MCQTENTILKALGVRLLLARSEFYWKRISILVVGLTHPGTPPLSKLLAISTSLDQMSNCHFLSPNTPHCSLPVWIPTLISTSTLNFSRTTLNNKKNLYKSLYLLLKSIRLFLMIRLNLHSTVLY